MFTKEYDKKRDVCQVTFIVPFNQLPTDMPVEKITVVGDFNNWDEQSHPMTQNEAGSFETTISFAPNQTYEYRYLLNEQVWYNDWEADGYTPNRLQNADNCILSLEGMRVDDLTKVSGIGPKISEILQANGIRSFQDLASATYDDLSSILEAAGKRYRLADPSSWPQQAQLAGASQWDKLKKLQEELPVGRRRE